jgi:hypothetical protein
MTGAAKIVGGSVVEDEEQSAGIQSPAPYEEIMAG